MSNIKGSVIIVFDFYLNSCQNFWIDDIVENLESNALENIRVCPIAPLNHIGSQNIL